MSFSRSNVTTGRFRSITLNGVNGIAGSGALGIYYTTDSGANWTQSNVTSDSIISVSLSGSVGIAGSDLDKGIYYTTDSGATWTPSNVNTGYISSVYLSGYNGIAGSSSDLGIYYTTDGGATWIRGDVPDTGSFGAPPVPLTGYFSSVYFLNFNGGLYGIAGSGDGNGIYFNIPTYNLSLWKYSYNVTTGRTLTGYFRSVYLYEYNGIVYGIAGSDDGNGIYYNNKNSFYLLSDWSQSTSFENSYVNFNSVYLYEYNGIVYGIAGSDGLGIFYSTDGGETWTQSTSFENITVSFSSVTLSEGNGFLNGLAASSSGKGIYYTTDGGETWTPSNTYAGDFASVALSGTTGLAGSTLTSGLYYASTPFCYEKNTFIKILENNQEIYKKIYDLNVGDLVKTYKHGYKKIKFINKFKHNCFDKKNPLYNMYKMKDHDIILTGGHSILVDELTEKEQLNNNKYNFNSTIEDKKLLLVSSSDKFEQLPNDVEYELCHLVLENENIYGKYGIYINDDILSETCSEDEFGKKFNI